ncbi:hypothetical protein PROVRUST_06163 [Providencia rustigianii DSM 4541]|uniref:Uncharacterized protein n=1 Tax=Providencia rustigianii DSM 4541 TaxID=500637 RepID=D1P1U0_9GAMM|nr:hypothetical protein PROVRUST_06163 [Providencia rustigianii DSM 4541]
MGSQDYREVSDKNRPQMHFFYIRIDNQRYMLIKRPNLRCFYRTDKNL